MHRRGRSLGGISGGKPKQHTACVGCQVPSQHAASEQCSRGDVFFAPAEEEPHFTRDARARAHEHSTAAAPPLRGCRLLTAGAYITVSACANKARASLDSTIDDASIRPPTAFHQVV